jgi:hypothetical protein
MAAYSKYPRCRDCGSEDAPHICGSSQHWEGPSGGACGGSDGHVYKIDKIIQITDTLTNDGEGQTLGLSESGKVYQYKCDIKAHTRVDHMGHERVWHSYENHRWELLVESPKE